jgi:hypothetical protein
LDKSVIGAWKINEAGRIEASVGHLGFGSRIAPSEGFIIEKLFKFRNISSGWHGGMQCAMVGL